MELKLRVETGKNAGQEIRISAAEFLIGRGDGCHLRAGSDMISRQHCMLIVGDSYAGLRDLGSKNGTIVNGEAVHSREVQLRAGDKLRIGPLEFSVVLNAGLTGKKLPAVHNVREAVARSTQGAANTADDIAGWLMEGDVASSKAASTDTQQMRMSDTEEIDIKGAGSSINDASASSKTTIFHSASKPAGDGADDSAEPAPMPTLYD